MTLWNDDVKPHPISLTGPESERCPDCGVPGVLLERRGDVEMWGCPNCDALSGGA